MNMIFQCSRDVGASSSCSNISRLMGPSLLGLKALGVAVIDMSETLRIRCCAA
jgi:hypothetical protein